MALKGLSIPTFRLYQQIILTFVLVVLVPLLGVSIIIYSINQTALKKELLKFTEHTVDTIYRDINTEMSWQKQQSQMMATYLLDNYQKNKDFAQAARDVFKLSGEFVSVGLYDDNGKPIHTASRYTDLPKSLQLPTVLENKPLTKAHYEIVHTKDVIKGVPEKDSSPYYLRVELPVDEKMLDGRHAAYYVQLRRFRYLYNVIQSHEAIYEGFYIINERGDVIAGPPELQQKHIAPEEFALFNSLKPGVTQSFSSKSENNVDSDPNNDDEEPAPLEKVIVKLPDMNWGVIIESPYHVRQKFIKRASTQSLLLIVACLILVVLLALVYVYGISRNFRQLIKGIKAMAEGNYFRRIRLITNFFTPYEIIYLTGEFNRMAKKRADAWHTIQEANEKLAKLDEFKSNLIDTVSHELRTPLTSIKGYTSRLLRYDDTLDRETRVKSLKVVKQQADRLSRLVEDLLVIPDLETDGLRVFPDEVDLTEMLTRAIQYIQAKDNREITVTSDGASQVSVLADPDRLEQILLNLLDNAVKYSEADTPILVNVRQGSDKLIHLSVANQCDPIPLESLGVLFDKFKRLDDSLVRTTRGSGLGLYITKGLVEAMGGEISLNYVESFFQVNFTIPEYARNEALPSL